MSMTARLLKGVSVSVLSLACAVAYADVQFEHSAPVRYSDLNLERLSDVSKLYDRIGVAADKVCGPRSLTGSYSKSGIYASCYADAVAQAVRHINKPALTTYYIERTQFTAHGLSVAQK
jgi:UrcA family protein